MKKNMVYQMYMGGLLDREEYLQEVKLMKRLKAEVVGRKVRKSPTKGLDT